MLLADYQILMNDESSKYEEACDFSTPVNFWGEILLNRICELILECIYISSLRWSDFWNVHGEEMLGVYLYFCSSRFPFRYSDHYL